MKIILKKYIKEKPDIVLFLIIILILCVFLLYQIIPFYVEKENETINHEISSECHYNIDYMNYERYDKERDNCLRYINEKTNQHYETHRYFAVFEKDNIISVFTANNHHVLKFETYKKENDEVKLVDSFYLIKPYQMTVNQYDFENKIIYVNILGLDLTEGAFLHTHEIGEKEIKLKNKHIENILEGVIETMI